MPVVQREVRFFVQTKNVANGIVAQREVRFIVRTDVRTSNVVYQEERLTVAAMIIVIVFVNKKGAFRLLFYTNVGQG